MKRVLLLGVGNDIRGDDAIGELIAREFEKEGWETIDCGTVPENVIPHVEEDTYDTVIIVDAAHLKLEPGEIRIVPRDRLGVFTMSTHAMPLSLVMEFLDRRVGEVILIGIQPKDMSLKEGMTEELTDAKDRLMDILYEEKWDQIPVLEKEE
ncbi:MAG: hydrogenase maturation peptidase HycI [Thermoplasmata archaeon]